MNNFDELLPSDLSNVKTLRDEIAMVAMKSWISASPKVKGETLNGGIKHAKIIAESAYTYADAMLAERSKTNDSTR